MPRVRRPLLALIALVAALAIGYGVRATQDHHHHAPVVPPVTSGSTAH